jgi:hypothetical protein
VIRADEVDDSGDMQPTPRRRPKPAIVSPIYSPFPIAVIFKKVIGQIWC